MDLVVDCGTLILTAIAWFSHKFLCFVSFILMFYIPITKLGPDSGFETLQGYLYRGSLHT